MDTNSEDVTVDELISVARILQNRGRLGEVKQVLNLVRQIEQSRRARQTKNIIQISYYRKEEQEEA